MSLANSANSDTHREDGKAKEEDDEEYEEEADEVTLANSAHSDAHREEGGGEGRG